MAECPRSGLTVKEVRDGQGRRSYVRSDRQTAYCDCGAPVLVEPVVQADGWCTATLPAHEQAGRINDAMERQREAWARLGFGPNGPPVKLRGSFDRIGVAMPQDGDE
jgi:hypothetical protein